MILLTSAAVTECDLTHKSQYLDEKLESGGGSREMMEIIMYVVHGQTQQ